MDFWKPNIGRGGRRLRLLIAIGFTLAGIAVWLTTKSFWPTLMLAISAAFVLFEDGRISARAVLRVAQDLAVRHHFDGGALARSYLELARRGHVVVLILGAGRERHARE